MKIAKHFNFIILILYLTSCASKKNYHYFGIDSSVKSINNNYNPVLKTGDIINIQVHSIDKEASEPFNTQLNNVNVRAGYTNGIATQTGYLINKDGNIDFPVVGEINILNLTTIDAAKLIKTKLIDYLNDPIVRVQIENFKITILGEVRSPGTYQIPNERITILEALGLAGDLTIYGIRKEVILLRDNNGEKNEFIIDLTSKDLIYSENYYLSQNDVLYIKPNQAKVNSSTVSSSYGIFISIASLIITTVNLLSK